MPFNGSGQFTLAEAPFVPNTPISSALVNSDFDDIAVGLSGVVTRDGQSPMSAVLPLANAGAVYASDPNTGIRRTAADTQAIFAGNVDVAIATPTGVEFPLGITVAGAPLLPPGFVGFTASAAAPAGWLLRNGAAVSRTTYAPLFAAIGTTYGAGDGSTTFNVPDSRGRLDAGLDGGTGRLPAYTALGTVGGLSDVALTTNQLPIFTPTFTGTANQSLSVTTTSTIASGTLGSFTASGTNVGFVAFNNGSQTNNTYNSTGTFTATGTISQVGGGNTHTNTQPTMALTPIIKT